MRESCGRRDDQGFMALPRAGIRIPAPGNAHPLAHIQQLVDRACADHLASAAGEAERRGMTAPRLIRAALLQSLYSYPCNEQLMEQLRYNALYRWFVGLRAEDPVWDADAYARALAALRVSEAGAALFRGAVSEAHAYAALLPGRFRIDPALFEAWTSAAPGETGDAHAAQSSRQTRLDRAQAVILRRIGDPSLTPEAIAAELCVSRRALYLLFEKHGLTPTRAIRELRLECCMKLLADARHRHRKITDIAMDYGFEHATSFSRQFKLRYGISPNEARTARSRPAGTDWRAERHPGGVELVAAH